MEFSEGGANTSFSEMDKSFLTRMNDRRHSSETNEMSSLSRDNRLSSLERENNKLLSPEKVLSLRRNSADVANDHTSQPLSSLLSEDPEHRISRLGNPFPFYHWYIFYYDLSSSLLHL